MGAYREAAAGSFDGKFFLLLKRCAAVAIKRHSTHSRWQVDELVNDWFAEAYPNRLVQAVATTEDDASLERYLTKALLNHLRAESRRTEFGSRLRAIRRLVSGDARFVVTKQPSCYSLTAHAKATPYSGNPANLSARAAKVKVSAAPVWAGDKRPPIGTGHDILDVIGAVLDEARAPVLERVVAELTLKRFGVPLNSDLSLTDADPSESGSTVERIIALEIWDGLDTADRQMLGFILDDTSIRSIAGATNSKKSTVHRRQRTLTDHLAKQLEGLDGSTQAEVSRVLAELVNGPGTTGGNLASISLGGDE